MSLFKGKPMIIHLGGTSRKSGQSQAGSTRLFHIRQSSSRATRAVEVGNDGRHLHEQNQQWPSGNQPSLPFSFLTQVEPTASKLNTNDAFVLKSPGGLFVWKGVGASDEEMAAAKHVCSFLGGSATEISEGKEPGGCLPFVIFTVKRHSWTNHISCSFQLIGTDLYLCFSQLDFGQLWVERRTIKLLRACRRLLNLHVSLAAPTRQDV